MMAVSHGFNVVPGPDCKYMYRCRAFKYVNKETYLTGVLFLCCGQCSYRGFGHTTAWHGHCRLFSAGRLYVEFQCDGDVTNLHVINFIETGDGMYEGKDYQGRRVTLELKANFDWCTTHEWWHRKSL